MTQEYTPVEWVDETENQIGTIINKARLDQMQTAHHYADGFKEVDTVPTADPGVDYHMVVFCTADTTFYRWNGTQWVKDVDDSTLALLEAHEADHNNPHVVTKAQVGLGNVDNKGTVSSWQGTPDDAHIPTEKLVKDSLDGKAPTSHASAGTTYGQGDATHYGHVKVDDSMNVGSDNPVKNSTIVGFVNSSIATNTANFKGTYDAVSELGLTEAATQAQVIAVLNAKTTWKVGGDPTNNDYCFVQFDLSVDPGNIDRYDRYKFSGTYGSGGSWGYEYTLNNSSFTQAQWNTINALITNTTTDPNNPSNTPYQGVDVKDILASMAKTYAVKTRVDKIENGTTTVPSATYAATAGSATSATNATNATYLGSSSSSKGSDTKPVKIVNGQAVAVTNDLVTTGNTNQTIAGVKTFTSVINTLRTNDIAITQKFTQYAYNNTVSSNVNLAGMSFIDKNNTYAGGCILRYYTNGSHRVNLECVGPDNDTRQLNLWATNGSAWADAPYRAYNSANPTDIMTIGMLKATQLKNQYGVTVTRCGPIVHVSLYSYNHGDTSEHNIFTDLPTAKSYSVGELSTANNAFNGGAWIGAGTKILKCQQNSAANSWGSFIYFTDD